MHGRYTFLLLGWLTVLTCSAQAAGLQIITEPYGRTGLFTRPLIPAEDESTTITLRATVEDDAPEQVPAAVEIVGPPDEQAVRDAIFTGLHVDAPQKIAKSFNVDPPKEEKHRFNLVLKAEEGVANTYIGRMPWTPLRNGPYTLTATLDPDHRITETDEANNTATLHVPVVVPGRRPHFVWYHAQQNLRWATIWAGNPPADSYSRWQERGVQPLRWHNGPPKKGHIDPVQVLLGYEQRQVKKPGASGWAVDELGLYPKSAARKRFAEYIEAVRQVRAKYPDQAMVIWHKGSLYPEEAALYRGACDLVLIESYVFNWGPAGLGTENIYDFLDMKMRPARQCDLLVPTGKGTQAITTIDLTYPTFERGRMGSVFRHLRRVWPEMRGIGFFGSCAREAPKEGAELLQRAAANNRYVDQLCYDYFVKPVVTIQPGDLSVHRDDDGYRITAALSNIGAMDSKQVGATLWIDGEQRWSWSCDSVPAGDNLKENKASVVVLWPATPGAHTIELRIESAPGSTVLDPLASIDYFVP